MSRLLDDDSEEADAYCWDREHGRAAWAEAGPESTADGASEFGGSRVSTDSPRAGSRAGVLPPGSPVGSAGGALARGGQKNAAQGAPGSDVFSPSSSDSGSALSSFGPPSQASFGGLGGGGRASTGPAWNGSTGAAVALSSALLAVSGMGGEPSRGVPEPQGALLEISAPAASSSTEAGAALSALLSSGGGAARGTNECSSSWSAQQIGPPLSGSSPRGSDPSSRSARAFGTANGTAVLVGVPARSPVR